MGDLNKTITVSFEALTNDLETKLKRIPGITEAEAKKMSQALAKELQKTEKVAAKSSKNIGKSFKQAGKAVAGIAAGAAVAGVAVLAFTQEMADLANELTDASTKTGIAADQLAGLRLAAEGSGLAFAALEPGLIKFNASIADAAQGTGPAAEAFERLGISATNTDGSLRDANSVFKDTTEALASIGNETERNALAMDIFGARSAAALIQSGALTSMQEFAALAKEFGVDMEQGAASAGQFQRAMAEINLVLQGVSSQILQSITGTDGLVNGLFAISEGIVYFGSIANDVLKAFVGGWEVVNRAVEMVLTEILGGARAFAAVLSGDFTGAIGIVQNTIGELDQLGTALSDAAGDVMDLGNAFDNANEQVGKLRTLREAVLNTTKESTKATQSNTAAQNDNADAAKAAAEAEKERAAAAKQAEADAKKAAEERRKAAEQLLAITKAAEDSQKTQFELELQRIDEEIARVNELTDITNDAAAQKAALDALQRQRNQVIYDENKKQLEDLRAVQLSFADTVFSSIGTTAQSIEQLLENSGNITKRQAINLFNLQKVAGVGQVAINTAIAISKALAELGPIFGPAAAGFIGAAGAAQTAAILSQPPPTFDIGGMIGNLDPLRPGEKFIRAQSGEAILDEATVQRLGGEQGIDRLQRGGNPSQQVVVVQAFKHFDKFVASSAARSIFKQGRRRPIGAGGY
jgi:flagellar biosynthesis GTPase FlhF